MPASPLPRAGFRAAAMVPVIATIVAAVMAAVAGSAHAYSAHPGNRVSTVAEAPAARRTAAPAVLALSVSRRDVTAGAVVDVSARLSADDGQRLGGAVITVRAVSASSGRTARIEVARAVTNRTGLAVMRVRVVALTRITGYARYRGQVLRSGAVLAAAVVRARGAETIAVVLSPVSRVLAVAASLAGRPYVWGAAGPWAFDCSGFTEYVMEHALGRWLPHNAEEQYRLVRQVSRGDLQPGDLVFFLAGGYAYHVAIYAGHGLIWQAPHPGDHVRLSPIFSPNWAAGQVI